MAPPSETAMRDEYLALLKRVVANYPYLGGEARFEDFDSFDDHYDAGAATWRVGRPCVPMTLLSGAQLDLIETSVVDLEARRVPGDYIEAGVWRGGAVALMRGLLKAYAIADRVVVAADSFSGIPLNQHFRHDPVDAWADRWAANEAEVTGHLTRLGLLDERIELLKGSFAESLPTLAHRRFALIRIDADAHDSVLDALTGLYPLLSPGGVIIIDDWHLVGCRFAVDAYRQAQGIDEPITETAGNGWWVKRAA